MASLTGMFRKQTLPRSFWPLAALTLLAVGLSIYRLVVGLGPTTNMSDHYPWGIWITVDLFLIPVAGAAFTISLISFFFGYEDYRTVLRPAVVAGFLGYAVVGILLFLDIGRWPQFYNIFVPGYINLHSFLEEISLCVTLYVIILTLEVLPIFLERTKWEKYTHWIERGIYIVAGTGILLSTLHQSSLGSMFLLMTHKLHPLWYTPALPVLFFLQAGYTGLGATAIAITLIWRSKGLPVNRLLIRRIGQAMGINLLLYVFLKIGDWMGAGEVPLLLRPDAFGWIAWLELVIGILVPLAILFTRFARHSQGPFWAGVFAIMGTFINRLIITWIGLAEPSPLPYVPSWIEILITVGFVAGAFLVYDRIIYAFRLLPDKPETD
ncbi:MAG: NrfD/PsrC family molybdoenzyme membrane anchor subunit [Chloroflexota bacterium]